MADILVIEAENLAHKIRLVRAGKRLTQYEVARQATARIEKQFDGLHIDRVSPSDISILERGGHIPKMRLKAVSAVLGIEAHDAA